MKGKSRVKVEKGRIPWIAKILFADARVDFAIDSGTPSRGASRVAGLTLERLTERDPRQSVATQQRLPKAIGPDRPMPSGLPGTIPDRREAFGNPASCVHGWDPATPTIIQFWQVSMLDGVSRLEVRVFTPLF
jgi:hypothetical protein